jgi:hypothetical protein
MNHCLSDSTGFAWLRVFAPVAGNFVIVASNIEPTFGKLDVHY